MTDVTRWDPFQDLDSIQDELNRLFGRTFSGSEKARPGVAGGWMPALDVYETADKVVVSAELPGLDPNEVEVSVEDSTLTIRGQRHFEQETDEQNDHRIERRYGSFARSIRLPQTADADTIQARFDKGLLNVEVPKREEAKPKRIEVKATA
jgi:HSP20 family protein